jgi:hypothetical protein
LTGGTKERGSFGAAEEEEALEEELARGVAPEKFNSNRNEPTKTNQEQKKGDHLEQQKRKKERSRRNWPEELHLKIRLRLE